MKILVVVDMQNDFIDGALGTKEAVEIVPLVVEKIKNFQGDILYTQDTHEEDYLNTQEGRNLPVRHCVRNTQGWRLCPQVEELRKSTPIEKPAFASVELAEILKVQDRYNEKLESVTFIGLCTDICIISNAMLIKAFLPETEIIVDASCCAGVTVKSHKQALAAMQVCQIKIENE